MKELFLTVQEILYYYHCSYYVHTVAGLHYGDRREQALERVEATMARLY